MATMNTQRVRSLVLMAGLVSSTAVVAQTAPTEPHLCASPTATPVRVAPPTPGAEDVTIGFVCIEGLNQTASLPRSAAPAWVGQAGREDDEQATYGVAVLPPR